MPWYFAVIEDGLDIQNPTSRAKIELLGEHLGLTNGSHVLDVASGRGGPALILAGTFGCRITGIEKAEEFDAVARRRVRDEELEGLVELIQADARQYPLAQDRYDAAICLGASFIWEGLEGTIEALKPAVRSMGLIVVGEPYWRIWPLPEGHAWSDEGYLPLDATIERFRTAELEPVSVIDASLDDWDRYESRRWQAADRWLRSHPDDPDAESIRSRSARDRDEYFRWRRDQLGWAIIAARKP
jgi:precorrin-6B methylase 2